MSIETVVREIDLAADEPLRPGRVPFEDAVPLSKPVKLLGDASPERFGILFGFAIELLVLFEAFDVSLLAELRREVERLGSLSKLNQSTATSATRSWIRMQR